MPKEGEYMSLFPHVVESSFDRCGDRVVRVIARLPVSPNSISAAGFLLIIAGSAFLAAGEFVIAGVLVLAGGLLDAFDGKIARLTKKESIYGAVFDATLDRVGEMALYSGLGMYLIRHGLYLTTGIAVVAIAGSILIRYVRARVESFNIPCPVGLLRRSERIVLFGTGSLFHFSDGYFHEPARWIITQLHLPYKYPPMPITLVLLVIAFLSPITIFQRLRYVRMFDGSRS